jgi:PII-like signaling protein
MNASRRRSRKIVEPSLPDAQIAEATAFLGIEGFGTHHSISKALAVDSYVDLPILIEAVDADDEQIRKSKPNLDRSSRTDSIQWNDCKGRPSICPAASILQ